MAEAYVGEIRLFPYSKVPGGWTKAEGQELTIYNNAALFSLIGTTYGGDGMVKFKLPDLRGRVPLCFSNNPRQGWTSHELGSQGGDEVVTLTIQTLPSHMHLLAASDEVGTLSKATEATIAAVADDEMTPKNDRLLYVYNSSQGDLVSLNRRALSSTGGGGPHPNMQPFTVASYCICTQGIFPSRQ